MKDDCIFCQIIKGEIKTSFRYEDEDILAFPDIHAKAPLHLLVIPKKHIPSLDHITDKDLPLLGKIYRVIQRLAQEEGLEEKGYRVVVNCKEDGGQTVFHLHFHLLGGRRMEWPPG